jgi:CheY-like chemotaxis protein
MIMSKVPTAVLSILLVEDDIDDIQSFNEAIQKLDVLNVVTVVTNCDELFAQLEEGKIFDVIFMDINIPLVDGKECLRKIKITEKFRDIPIVMFTGSSSETDVADAYENGAHYHVVKPYAHINYVESLKIVLKQNWKEKPARPSKENFVVNLTFN